MRALFYLSLILLIGVGFVTWNGYGYFRKEFPDVSTLKHSYPRVHYQGKKQVPRVTLQRGRPDGWVSLKDVARVAVGAVIVSEDWAFFQHKGYDPVQIKEAIKEDFEEGKFARGASTITQQVVKNVFLERDKNVWRKVKELILAVRLESQVSKSRILEVYLNIAEWGEGVFGIAAASQHYFKKPPSQLSAKEGAFLAMLLPSPKRYSQSYRQRKLTHYARRTIGSILNKMVKAQYINDEQLNEATMIPLSFEAIESDDDPSAPLDEQEGEEEGNDPGFRSEGAF